MLRGKLFDLARDGLTESNGQIILNWLEEVSKLLIRTHEKAGAGSDEVYFSPGTECREAIIRLIRSAEKLLRVCVFTISDNAIARELTSAHKRGVTVKIITDDEKRYDMGSDIFAMRKQGVAVHCDNSPSHMHHKFAIADERAVLTGSYNWTSSAASANQENLLISYEPATVQRYVDEFERLWKRFR